MKHMLHASIKHRSVIQNEIKDNNRRNLVFFEVWAKLSKKREQVTQKYYKLFKIQVKNVNLLILVNSLVLSSNIKCSWTKSFSSHFAINSVNSKLPCRANQLTGFYMIATLAFNELMIWSSWFGMRFGLNLIFLNQTQFWKQSPKVSHKERCS